MISAGTTLYVLDVPPEPATSPAPSGSPAIAPTSRPASSSTPLPSATPLATVAATPVATPSVTPVPSPSPSPTATSQPTAPASIAPPSLGTPAPSAAASLAILTNVALVGDAAAYSGDGQWFAFSARPAGSTTGPDIYVWRAGWPEARPLTDDHNTVFSGWVDGQILASRAIPVASMPSPVPSVTDGSGPGAAPSVPATPAAAASGAPSPSSADASSEPASGAASPAVPALLATPAAYLVDPATGQATRIAGLDGWRPVVNSSDRWVAFWSGTLSFDPATGAWQPFQGQLEIGRWAAIQAAVDGPAGAANAHPLSLGDVSDWEVRWDEAGQHLGVWLADSDNPGLGRLSLLTIDPSSGLASAPSPALLTDTPAMRGFALKDGQLVWASPPGQDGTGSRLSILAWTGQNAGKTTIQSIDSGALIVVP